MHTIRIDIDSDVFGKDFLEIKDFDPNTGFADFESGYVRDLSPYYVFCKIPVEWISDIQALERYGFEFIEFQVREQLTLKKEPYPVFKPYVFEEAAEADLPAIYDIAATTFEHDRFTIDPRMTGNFSGDRYKAYVLKSLRAEDEFLYKLTNSESGEIVGFKTHKIVNGNEAVMFLGGVVNKYKKTPIPVINGYCELNELLKKGVRKVTTHISGGNYGVLNLEVKQFGYKVVQGFVVLRKIYAD